MPKIKRPKVIKTTVAFSVENCGDGSAYPKWFLNETHAETHQDNMSEGWGETCTGTVQTYRGSDIHKKAVKNSAILKNNPNEEYF